MATQKLEVELLGPGTDARSSRKSSFVLNMLSHAGGWEVRKGFGQLAQFDSKMSSAPNALADEWGYMRHVGSHLIKTDFGHEQIISVHTVKVYTGSYVSGQAIAGYAISIYDITTDTRWEQVLHRRTSEENRDTLPMPRMLGAYSSNRNDDVQRWVLAANPGHFWFTELDDVLYMGNSDTGVLAYFPSIFGDTRSTQLETAYNHDWALPHSEDPTIVHITATDGVAAPGYTYLTKSEFPRPSVAASVFGRMAYVVGKTIFFSDPQAAGTGGSNAASIAAINQIVLDTEGTVTALAELRGSLYVFTDTETFIYHPSDDFVISNGQMVRLSGSIGCLGPSAVAPMKSSLAWVDQNGVHSTDGSGSINTLSDAMEEYFRRYITNPLTSFYNEYTVAHGHTDLSTGVEQPRTVLSSSGEANLTYHHELDALLVSFPSEDTILCLTEGQWSVWTTQSMIRGTATLAVGVWGYVTNPWLMSNGERLFLVGGIDVQQLTDNTDTTNGASSVDITSRSYYILEYGRGGMIDRYAGDGVDDRQVRGEWAFNANAATVNSEGYIYFGKPEPIPDGYVLPNSTVSLGANEAAFLVPVYCVPDQPVGAAAGGPYSHIAFEMIFDNSRWIPYFVGGAGREAYVDVEFPPERGASVRGWGYAPQAIVANTTEIQVYSIPGGAGFASAGGYSLRCYFDGAAAGIPAGTWTTQPDMNLSPRHLNPLFWIPMHGGPGSANDGAVHSMGWTVDNTVTGPGFWDAIAGNEDDFHVYVWEETSLVPENYVAGGPQPGLRDADKVMQAIDWCYMPAPVELEDARVIVRGLRAKVVSHGDAVGVGNVIGNPWGLVNLMAAADGRAWFSHIIDYSGPDEQSIEFVSNKFPLLRRIVNPWSLVGIPPAPTGGVMAYAVFGTADPIWGNSADAAVGNVLATDEETNEVPMSIRIKGNTVSLMLFGFTSNPTEVLRFESIRALYKKAGVKKRRGYDTGSGGTIPSVPSPPTLES